MSIALPAGVLDTAVPATFAALRPCAPIAEGLAQARCLIIIPAYNEERTICRLVERLKRALPEMDVLVIDDGSTDSTAREAAVRARTISLPFNVGIGGAMQTGYRYAEKHGYDIAIQVDGDGQHRPCEVRKLVREVLSGRADLAVGSRFLGDANRMRAMPGERGQGYRQELPRTIGAGVLRMLLRWMAGLDVTDCTSGFRAANRNVIRAFAHWYPEDYPEPEVILLLHRAGYRLVETPVSMRQRRNGSSTISPLTGVFYVMKVALCLLLDLARQPWDNDKVRRP